MKRHGNVALITGGGGGLGKAFASALLEADVCSGIMLAEVNETLGRTAARELQQRFPDRRILSSRCDVANEQDIEDVINETDASLGKMTIMVNNAVSGRQRSNCSSPPYDSRFSYCTGYSEGRI
eukprot:gb/GECG01007808.1/.p1 GENE.gb/GECG01007808.1/~~gb/GECG01007808.1/.p1  ORF type:complete len:124 (+),score=15.93 gb/GECG01007808.1/:1-372(+)